MKTPYIKKTISRCCGNKEERRRKSKKKYLRKTIERYFERSILTYLNNIIQDRRRFSAKMYQESQDGNTFPFLQVG